MAFTREQAYAALASLNPAQVFLDSYRIRRLPENLDIYFRPPEEFFLAGDSQEPYTRNSRFVPILDDGNFGVVTFLNPETRELVQIDVEAPGETRATFRHWQQYLADLMIQVGEVVEEDESVRRIGRLIGFDHTDALFAYYARTEGLSGDAWWEERRQFPLSIPG